MPGRTDRRLRSAAVLVMLVALGAIGVLRLAYWQVVMGPDLAAKAQRQIRQTTSEPALRGDILDRYGNVLATTGFRDTLAAWPDRISDERRPLVVERVTAILGLDETGSETLLAKLDPESQYAVLDRELTSEQSQAVRAGIADGSLGGLVLSPHAVRIYVDGGQPGTTLASQLLGFVQASDGTGHYGIEQQYDAVLSGMPRRVAVARDRFSRPLESSELVLDPGVDGKDVRLTIDASLQLQLEKELYLAWNADRAQRVSGLVMDPATGEVLAWASVPGYDANDISGVVAAERQDLFQDPIVSQVYEPGSVMKMLTATAALETKAVTPSTRIVDSAVIRFGPDRVRNSDRKGMGKIAFRDVIAYSRNVGVSKVAARLGTTTAKAARVLYQTWQRLGIGRLTGVDVAGEVAGLAADPKTRPWADVDLANRSFGQAVAVTLVQLATAFVPMIDGGLRVQPHFLLAIGDETQPTPATERVMKKKTAKQVRALLTHVTASVPSYAAGSLIRHYEVGGKTGTAQIWRDKEARYDPDTFNFSFVGYVGGDEPAAVVAVRIHEADPVIKGDGDLRLNITSFQLFQRIARDAISSLDVRRSSDPNAGLPEAGSAAERVLGTAAKRKHREAGE
ncbi:MAG: penicillin-binding protein 2 [Chloroflexota bacterium]